MTVLDTASPKMFSFFKEGFLQKQGKRKVQGYKKRWFVLSENVIKYYPSQEITENSVLGVIDTARVVSVKINKHVKNGFEISTEARTYFLAAKTTEEKEEWIRIIQSAAESSRKLEGSPGHPPSAEASSTYDVIGSSNAPLPQGLGQYDVVGGAQSYTSSSPMQSYSQIGDEMSSSPHEHTHPAYIVVGQSSGTVASNYQMTDTALYDTVPSARPYQPEAPECIYDTIVSSGRDQMKEPSPSIKRLPLNDRIVPEGDACQEEGSSLKMSSIMSKLSVESLDSIDSLDLTELTDDELQEDETDGHLKVDDKNALPAPLVGSAYACDDIKKFLKKQGIDPKPVDFAKVSKQLGLELDTKSDYPAFDALRKAIDIYKLQPTS